MSKFASGLFSSLESCMVLARTARGQRGADERRDDADGSGIRCFGRAAQTARGDRGRRQQQGEACPPPERIRSPLTGEFCFGTFGEF